METVIIADVAGRELRAGDLLAARFRARGMHAWFALPSTESVARCPVMDVSLGGARIAVGLAVEARLRVGERISIMVHLEGRPEWFLPIQAKVMRVGGGQTAVRFLRAPPVELLQLLVPLPMLAGGVALERRGKSPR
jgi:hypothetical protein